MRPTARQLCSAAPCARVARMSRSRSWAQRLHSFRRKLVGAACRRGARTARAWQPMVSLHAQRTCRRVPQKSKPMLDVPSAIRVHIKGLSAGEERACCCGVARVRHRERSEVDRAEGEFPHLTWATPVSVRPLARKPRCLAARAQPSRVPAPSKMIALPSAGASMPSNQR